MTCPYLGRLPPMGPGRNDAEEVSTKDAKGRESEEAKRISSGLRSSNGPMSGFRRGLSQPFPGSFVLFEGFVDPHRRVPAQKVQRYLMPRLKPDSRCWNGSFRAS